MTQRSARFSCRTAAGCALLHIIALVQPVTAESLAPHMATAVREILLNGKQTLESADNTQVPADVAQRYDSLLQELRIKSWAKQSNPVQNLATEVATALELDMANADHWAYVSLLLSESDRDAQLEILRSLNTELHGDETDGQLSRMTAAFDEARSRVLAGKDNSFTFVSHKSSDELDIEYNVAANQVRVKVSGEEDHKTGQSAFDLYLSSPVAYTLDAEGNAATLASASSDLAINYVTEEDRQSMSDSILGEWREEDDSVWVIESTTGDESNRNDQRSAAQRLESLKAERRRLDRNIAYQWENTATGEVISQEKFRRLSDEYKYIGEVHRDPSAPEKIAAIDREIEALESEVNLPVASHDPVSMEDDWGRDDTPSMLRILVTRKTGHVYTYDEAERNGLEVKAKRTLRDIADINPDELPLAIRSELIASWSPPEWIELALRVDPESGQPYLEGNRWRLHVTWSSMYGDAEVGSIHTPYSKRLRLNKGETNSAEGAVKDEQF